MSKVFSILFSSIILLQSLNFSFEDLSKVNTLLEHAEFHQENYGDTFLEFVTEHYGKTMFDHQNEHQEHEELPFKHKHDCNNTNYDFTRNNIVNLTRSNENLAQLPLNFFYLESYSSFVKPKVFQPPKSA